MYNRKVLIDALKKLGSAKAPSVQKDNEYFPYQGESYFSMAKGGEAPYKKVSVQKSNVQGKGLFADEPIGAGEIIGLSHTKFMFKKNGEDYIKSQETPIIGKYYNHSDDAFNVESIVNGDKRYLRALRDINPGEEILGNYYEDDDPTLESPDDFKKGGSAPKLPKKKNSKGYSRSLEATNRLFAEHPLFAKPRSRKKKIYDPKSKYYRDGGTAYANLPAQYESFLQGFEYPNVVDDPTRTGYNSVNNTISYDSQSPIENMNNDWWREHEMFHHLQNISGGMSTSGILGQRPNPYVASDESMRAYYDRRDADIERTIDAMIAQNPDLQFIPRDILRQGRPGLVGAEQLQYSDPTTLEGEARQYEQYIEAGNPSIFPKQQNGGVSRTKLSNEDEQAFQKFYSTLPENLQSDDDTYDIRGYWDGLGRPEAFDYSQPKESDGYYHAFSINPNTGEYLKSPAHETFQHAVDEDRKIGYRPISNVYGRNIATYNPSIIEPTPTTFLTNTAGPANYIETELTPEEIEEYAKGGYIIEDISIPSLNKAKKGGLVKARKGLPVTAGIKLLNLPGVKPIIRSNYNILSYPIKYMGARIGRQSSLKERDWNHIKSTFNPIKYDAKYFGQLATSLPPEYGYGKRDLLANYFFGDDRGFTPIEYDLDSDLGLKEVIKPYGNVSAYLMNSAYKHGEPISIYNFTGFARPQVPFKLENQPTTFDLDDGYYILGTHDKNFDKWKESFLEENPDFEKMKRAEYEENVLKSLDQHPSTLGLPVDFETTLLPSSALGREYYKHNLNKIFDDYQTDRLQFDISPDYKAKENKNLLYFDINPINTKDNVGGHMGFLTRKPNNEYEWTSRDLWSFRPGDYDLKWEMKNPWKKLQVELMDSFGKPFILHQTNPIKFKKGGLIKAWNGLTVPAKAIGTGLKTLGKQGYSAMFSDLRPILYKSINPASYAVADKLKSLPKEIYKNTVYNDTRPFRVGESMLLGLDRNLNTLLNRHELTKDQYFALSDPERAKLYKPLELEDIVNKGKRRLDAWAVGLKLPQEYSTLEQVGDDTYRMKNLNYTPDFFSERYTDLLANRLNKSNILYSGEDPLITLSRNHYDLTKHPFLQIGHARDPMQQELIEKWSSLRRSQIDDYLGYKNDFQPWTQKRAVGLSTINPDKSFTDSIWDTDIKGVMGGFRWDIAETPEGIHWQANDMWDINPFEKRSSTYLNPDEQTLKALNSSYFAPLKGFEALSAVGGRPFSIKNNFLVEPKTFKILKEWEDGGETDYELGDEVDEATMQELKRLGYTFEKI